MSLKWMLDRWAEEVGRALQSMTDSRPETSCDVTSAGSGPSAEGAVILEVTFSVGPGTVSWIALGQEATHALGKRTLEAAGIDDAGPEELQNTCLEILQQAHAGVAQAISGRLKRAVTSKGQEVSRVADGNTLYELRIVYPDTPPIFIYVAAAANLLSSLDPPAETAIVPPTLDDRSSQLTTSKTFEVLLDVSLPVSVSFGRTEMAIKEVLKLTTGSIVELNRALTEPVEVVINDRVIARGEVVVVDGNYGVRIHNIVSRQERFRTTAPAAMIAKSDPNP